MEVYVFAKPLDSINAEDVKRLIDIGADENVHREFKSALPWSTKGERKSLVTHISAIANAGGGDIWFGIREEKGAAVEAVGVANGDLDELQRGIEQAVRDGTDPPITGLRFHPVKGFGKDPVLLLRVPRTWAEPHMVTIQDEDRFYVRDTGSRHRMSPRELRDAFNRADAPSVLARQFRTDRLEAIRNGNGAVPLGPQPKLVVHVFPLAAFYGADGRNLVANLQDPDVNDLLRRIGARGRYNVDGYLRWECGRGNENVLYMQYFRWGAIEIVSSYLFDDDSDRQRLYMDSVEQTTRSQAQYAIDLLSGLAFDPPFVIMPALLSVKGFEMPANPYFDWTPIDKDDVIMPETVLNERKDVDDLNVALCDSFDVMWNAIGLPERMTGTGTAYRPWRKAHADAAAQQTMAQES